MGNFGYIFGYCLFGVFCLGVAASHVVGRIIKMIDTNEVVKEADQYVRDHLLIEFMMEYYLKCSGDVEDIYHEWKEWLKEREAQNAERSKI